MNLTEQPRILDVQVCQSNCVALGRFFEVINIQPCWIVLSTEQSCATWCHYLQKHDIINQHYCWHQCNYYCLFHLLQVTLLIFSKNWHFKACLFFPLVTLWCQGFNVQFLHSLLGMTVCVYMRSPYLLNLGAFIKQIQFQRLFLETLKSHLTSFMELSFYYFISLVVMNKFYCLRILNC